MIDEIIIRWNNSYVKKEIKTKDDLRFLRKIMSLVYIKFQKEINKNDL